MRHILTRMAVCVFWLLAMQAPFSHAQEQTEDANLLKAAFIYNFAKFTRWPDEVWAGEESPLNLCLAGSDSLTDAVEMLEGKPVKEHRVSIKQISELQDLSPCHMLYIASSEGPHLDEILGSAQGKSILTISELSDFASAGGMIELIQQEGHTRFIINKQVANQHGLRFSSRLLSLAIVNLQKASP